MGSKTTSSQTGGSGFIDGEKDYLLHKGKDTEGITDYFQYHDQHLSKLDGVKLTYSDKFFRESFRPMNLMNARFFNNVLDQFVDWSREEHAREQGSLEGSFIGEEFNPEFLPYALFIQYFTEDQNHMVQIFDKEGPMRCVFRFGSAFTRSVKKKKLSDTCKDEKLQEIVEQVFRESMLNPATMNFLSDEKQNQYLKESLQVSLQLSSCQSECEDDEDQQKVRFVDLFSLRVLSLLACRGKPTEKAKLLADLVNQSEKEPVSWDNPRLRKVVRQILYFSSILPLKFLSINQDEDVFDRILSLGKY